MSERGQACLAEARRMSDRATAGALERDAETDLDDARRLDGGGQSRGRAGDRELFDFERLVEDIVGVDDRGQAARADREAFLQPRIDGHRSEERRVGKEGRY